MHKTIVLVGMMGAGKTAVGTALARLLGVPFRDSDKAIEEAANALIAEIFARDGETFFRDREAQVIARLLDDAPAVLSTGGGAWLQERNRALISQKGVAVWLRADVELLWSRVRHKTTRPLLRTADPRATLEALCTERAPAYAQADLVVDAAPELSIEAMAGRVLSVLERRPDVITRKVSAQ